MSVTSLRLKPELEKSLEQIASKKQRSKNWLINEALKEYIEKQTLDAKRWEETVTALQSLKEGKKINEADIDSWLQSWGNNNELPPPK